MAVSKEKLEQIKARLRERRDMLNVKLQKIEGREKSSEHAKDTRRKILIGAYWLERVRQGNTDMADVKKWMDGFLTRNNDRILFDLPVKENKQEVRK